MTNYQEILYEVKDRVLTITLNRPDHLNALTQKMGEELGYALTRADDDDNIRVVIVTGAGRAFCAGADLSSGGNTFDPSRLAMGPAPRDGGGVLTLQMVKMKKPLIAAINGAAVGFGVTMTLPMDIRIAADDAKIGFVFARRGIVPESCSAWFLPRIVGISRAMEWVATGRIFGAQEALDHRLISRSVPKDQVLVVANQLAREIADNTSAVSVALSRQLLWSMLGASHPMDAHIVDSKALFYMGASADAMEGIQAFLEKRPAQFPMSPSRDMPDFYPWWEEPKFK